MFSCDYLYVYTYIIFYIICCILGLVKKKLVSHPNFFFKGTGKPLLFSIHEFFAISFKDGRHV